MTPYFREIVMVDPRYYYEDIENVISSKRVTDVLFLYNVNTFLSDNSLADVLVTETDIQETQESEIEEKSSETQQNS